ncbi:MAG: 3-deoxy-manno-octulosonate cytidylyltransferase family protein [Gemmobacter sp.]
MPRPLSSRSPRNPAAPRPADRDAAAAPEVVLIIPARFASRRFPGKPLATLRGATGIGASLVERTWRAARAARGVDAIYVATDDRRIQTHCEGFGAAVVMTSASCRNGTERCAEAIGILGIAPRIVINLQGDAPLTPPWFIEALIEAMRPGTEVATTVLRCTPSQHAALVAEWQAGIVGGTTVVRDAWGRALYFSKAVIPASQRSFAEAEAVPVFQHVGVYAYTPAALAAYRAAGPAEVELVEGLEQLRFLVQGVPVLCVEVPDRGRRFWELNNPPDVGRIEEIMAAEHIA